jgi:hypothetical protein
LSSILLLLKVNFFCNTILFAICTTFSKLCANYAIACSRVLSSVLMIQKQGDKFTDTLFVQSENKQHISIVIGKRIARIVFKIRTIFLQISSFSFIVDELVIRHYT